MKKLLTWREVGVEGDNCLNWLRLKYVTFANFTETYKVLLEHLPRPCQVPAQIGEGTWTFISIAVSPPLHMITVSLFHPIHMRIESCTIQWKFLWPSGQTITTHLTVHPLQSPSISRKFHNPIGLPSKYVSPIQPVNVITRTASAFCREKYNVC